MSSNPILLLLADTDGSIEREVIGSDHQLDMVICPDLKTGLTPEQWSRVQYIIASHLYTVDKELQDRCPSLKVIVRLGIGVDSIDVAYAASTGVAVCNVPDYGIEEVADTTVAHILALFRQTTALHQALQDGVCYETFTQFVEKAHPSRRIRGKTLGMIGMGNIGMAVCTRAKALGFDVMVYDPYLRPGTDKALGITQVDSLDYLIQNSNCVSLHCPLTPETANVINSKSLQLFKKDAFLVNTSRGGQIDEAALAEALKSGQLGGAALDVQVTEPFKLKGSVFDGVPNLILTPHAAWYSKESYEDVRTGAIKAVKFCLTHSDCSRLPNFLNAKTIDKEACKKRWSKL
ncbi:PREDICTED: C-terminal-binding protein 1-like [Amphimedon queenslandica]|uniref:C-terminal binding protein n=1 Tax=Amphimedon queenslandica TaxID=400682 RepID=A0A1X7VQ18_AMPQE|nr:PREDICTED: C-terminal-binding protein 1-like [Amphimedon queenslandica]|eukprot:XP_003383320.1 PREDICTED: C-terminal-binding protein 1-like [Amphimedon queenslandica]